MEQTDIYFKDRDNWKKASRAEPGWLSMPEPVERQLLHWQKNYPDLIKLDSVTGYSGLKTYVAIVTDPRVAYEDKIKVLAFQPHGHEPAQTAGVMDFISQLLRGETLLGKPAQIDGSTILQNFYLVLNPLGNPDGRQRGGIECFDETFDALRSAPGVPFEPEDDHSEVAYLCGGKLADRVTFGYGEPGVFYKDIKGLVHPSTLNLDPNYPIGLLFERVGEDDYADSWSIDVSIEESPTSLARLITPYLKEHPFKFVLDLHQIGQGDYVTIWYNNITAVTYPHELADEVATQIEEDWKDNGFPGKDRLYFAPPTGHIFAESIHDICPGNPPILTIEVGAGCGGKNTYMSKWRQLDASISAIQSTLQTLLHARAG